MRERLGDGGELLGDLRRLLRHLLKDVGHLLKRICRIRHESLTSASRPFGVITKSELFGFFGS
jgi:hypothetical protein